jgi:RHS repeat-associated protein
MLTAILGTPSPSSAWSFAHNAENRITAAESASCTDVSYYALADANKNITEYVDGSGTIQTHYEYSPFGKFTQSSGTMASDFDYRFSSEVFDTETGLVYYNYRCYSSESGRLLRRDPIEEEGGWNLYVMVGIDAVNWWDDLGLIGGEALDFVGNALNPVPTSTPFTNIGIDTNITSLIK